MKTSEFSLIGNIKSRFPLSDRKVTGIGDDTAVFGENKYLITTDALADGVHFISAKTDFRQLGYKSMAVNISDIAAMGGYPLYALLTLGLPKNLDDQKIDQFIAGMEDIRGEFSYDLIGGDTVASESLFISISVIGLPYKKPILRSGAKLNDYIYVSGSLGDSAIGLGLILDNQQLRVVDPDYFLKRHMLPAPRVNLMKHLVNNCRINSAIDISDGLLADLGHIADESRLGFSIDANLVPIASANIGESFQTSHRTFIDFALTGGEDYEIVLTSPDQIDTRKVLEKTGVNITLIGHVTKSGRNVQLDGQTRQASEWKQGFVHF